MRPSELGRPDAGRVEDLEHGPVAQAFDGVEIGLGEHRFDFGDGHGRAGLPALQARELEVGGRVDQDAMRAGEPAEPLPHRHQPGGLRSCGEGSTVGLAVMQQGPLVALQHPAGDVAGPIDATSDRPFGEQGQRDVVAGDRGG
ncbi:MAG TPA: hypothetical protein VFV32_04010 [Acidimicrobiales bacterium]|nr:hypothetical protein [Acidimicrobiales bacterium]